MRKDIVIILPAYNEAGSIVEVLSGLRDFEVIVVDDGSKDQTATLASQVGADVIRLPQHSGKGVAIRTGIAHALSKFNFDAAILLDSDRQHNPKHVQEFLELWDKKRPDIILGVRDLNSRTVPLFHTAYNKFINFFISILSGRKFSDSQCGFRLLSRYALSKLNLTQCGYEIETEIILDAVKNNLDIVEVPIETIYYRQLTIFGGMGRAVKIFAYVLIRGTPLLIRRVIFLLQNLVKSQWRWIALTIFLGLLVTTFYQSVEEINIGFIQRQQFLSQELGAALRWLKENSEPDAIVMAPWFRGNQIIAFANRRVVATTKVYPSEAMEVAKRYRDIASFFLNESDEDAKAIAERYGASYVFIDKNFQAWLCKAINRCEYATPNRGALNPVGLARTIAGRMSQGGELQYFHKVWDSPRFVIYKITDEDVGLSLEEKQVALKIAREVISSLLLEGRKRDPADFYPWLQQKKMVKFFEPRNVDVTIWNDGHVRASRIGIGGSLIDNLVKAAIDATHDSRFFLLEKAELKDMRIEVVVFNNDYAPLTADMITANRIDPLKGYRLTHEGRTTYFLPEIFVVSRPESLEMLLAGLCRKGGLANNCYRTSPVEVFDVEDFIENATRSDIVELSGPISVLGEKFSQELLGKRMRLAARWLLSIQKPNGRFVFKINPIIGAESQAPDLPRNALAGQALVEAYNASGDGRYLAAAKKSATYLKNALQEIRQRDKQFKPPLPYLNFGLLQNLALFQATGDPAFRIEAESLADALWSRLENNGSFGGPKIADYQAFFALVQYVKSTNDRRHLDNLTKLHDAYKQRFRQERILKNNSQSLAVNAWLVNGFKSFYDLTRDQDDADFVFEVASWLADYRFTSGPTARTGAFFNKPNHRHIYTRGTGKVAEAMADAYFLAAELKQQYLAEYYQTTLAEALNWLMSMQLTEDSAYFVSRKNAFAAIGGLRHDLLDFELWNDSAAHFILAAANYLQHDSGS
jgi:glycosyltransferase involved in cell wall biosynthesis/AMMECR1 domain-containing protein